MGDHDQFFKTLIREFFSEFFELFFPTWAERFDLTKVEWLDKELFLDPPQGEKRSVDLLARLLANQPITGNDETWLALVHIEIESAETVSPLRRRMFEYYEHLRRRHGLPVLPIGLYLRVGLDGIGWDIYTESFWGQELVRFRYPYVGLPALDGQRYVAGNNWLGVALTALMRVPMEQRLEVAKQAWRRLVQCPMNDYRRFLLCACVDSYAPLEESQRLSFEQDMLHDQKVEVRTMSIGMMERWKQQGLQQGLQVGLQQGVQQGQKGILLKQLDIRFGPLSGQIRQRIENASPEETERLAVALLTAKSLAELGLDGPSEVA